MEELEQEVPCHKVQAITLLSYGRGANAHIPLLGIQEYIITQLEKTKQYLQRADNHSWSSRTLIFVVRCVSRFKVYLLNRKMSRQESIHPIYLQMGQLENTTDIVT